MIKSSYSFFETIQCSFIWLLTERQGGRGGGLESSLPGLTYPELLFSLNEEKNDIGRIVTYIVFIKMSRSILDYKYGGCLILRFCSDIDF